jgi:hypothetical protein
VNKVGRYAATLPERTTRAGAAVFGGVVREATGVALPPSIRQSRLYQAIVARLLRITIELIGDVRGLYPAEPMSVQELTVRKGAGNVVELASIIAVGWSPLWLLAAASDVMGGSKAYLRALAAELERARLLPVGSDVSTYEDLLARLETTSAALADTVDVPPLRVADARAVLTTLRQQADDLPTAGELRRIFDDLQATARAEGRSVAEVSAAIGLAAARAGFELGNVHVFAYYKEALRAIAEEGLLTFLRRVLSPYAKRAVDHFDPAVPTYTDRVLDWLDRWLAERRERDRIERAAVGEGESGQRVAADDGERAELAPAIVAEVAVADPVAAGGEGQDRSGEGTPPAAG